jgi:outer membrane protein assembly factor BamB
MSTQLPPLTAVIVCGVLVLAGAVLAAPGTTDWRQAGYGPGLTGYNPTATGPAGDVGPDWVTTADGVGVDVSMVTGDGRLYVAVHEGRAYAFDLATGEQLWTTPLGEATDDSPAAVGELLVVPVDTAERWTLVGVDAASGERRWTYDPPSERRYSWSDSDVVVADGLVLATAAFSGPDAPGDPFLAAVDPAAGTERWRTHLPGRYADHLLSTPAALDGRAYILARTYDDAPIGHVLAFDLADGRPVWNTTVPIAAETVLAADGTVFAAGAGVVALDPATGVSRGTVVTESHRFTHPAYADGTLFVLGAAIDVIDPRTVVAVDAATGTERWRSDPVAGGWIETQPVVTERYVLYGTVDGELHALDRGTGALVWNHTVDERLGLDTPPVPVGDTVYVVTNRVYALTEGGTAVPGGFLGRVGEFLQANAVLGFAVMGVGAGLTTGLVLGVVSLLAVELTGLSRVPQRLLAARLFRTPVADVRPGQRYAAHLLASVGLALGVGAVAALGWGVVPLLAALMATILPALVPVLATVSGVGTLALVVGVFLAAWWVLAYRWLPADESLLDKRLAVVRRDWAIVHVGYALALSALFPFVAFVFGLLVFQPF